MSPDEPTPQSEQSTQGNVRNDSPPNPPATPDEEEESSEEEDPAEPTAKEKARRRADGWIDKADDDWYSDDPTPETRNARRRYGWR